MFRTKVDTFKKIKNKNKKNNLQTKKTNSLTNLSFIYFNSTEFKKVIYKWEKNSLIRKGTRYVNFFFFFWKKGDRGYVSEGKCHYCPLMLKYMIEEEKKTYLATKRGQGSGVCIRGSLYRDGVPGNTIAWGQASRGFILKKKKKPATVLCFCDDISLLSFRSFSFLKYTRNVCCIIQE